MLNGIDRAKILVLYAESVVKIVEAICADREAMASYKTEYVARCVKHLDPLLRELESE